LRSEAGDFAETTRARGFFEIGQRRDAELLVDRARPTWPEARHLKERRERDGEVAADLIVELDTASLQVLDDLGFERGAHPLQLAQTTLLEQHVEAFGGATDAARTGAVGVVAVGWLAFDLEDVADFGKQPRDLGIGAGCAAALIVKIDVRVR